MTNFYTFTIFYLNIILCLYVFHIMCNFFFFSSRRRHTRYIGDWSSDVCSSDLPTTGSTITHAIWCLYFWNACSTADRLLKGRATVNMMNSSGTPADPGIPKVATPEPAFTNSGSAWP